MRDTHLAQLRDMRAFSANSFEKPALDWAIAELSGAVRVPLATLHKWHSALEGYDVRDVPDTVAARNEIAAMIEETK
jgi:hypothetical protein